jgi:hypothetical protein
MEETELKIDDLKFNAFNDEELESLQLFHKQVEKMNACKVVKDNSLGFQVSHESTGHGAKTTIVAPDDDELGLLLLYIRPCLLQKDRIFFNKILNILGKKAANEETRKYFGTLHKAYQFFLKSTPTEFRVDGKKYGEHDIFEACLNGKFFHIRDEEPLRIVELFEQVPHIPKTAVISCIIDYLHWFRLIDRIIAFQLSHSPEGS